MLKRDALEMRVIDEILQQVLKFIYLGTEINQEVKSEKEIERRCNIAKEKFSNIAHLLTTKKLKISTKIRIVKCYVYSIFTYGCESWTLSKILEDTINAMEMWCMRRLGNVQWSERVTNESVLEKLQTKRQLLNSIQKRKKEIYRPCEKKRKHINYCIRGENRRQKTSWKAKKCVDD